MKNGMKPSAVDLVRAVAVNVADEPAGIHVEKAAVDPDHCQGCGLCVAFCPAEKLRLAQEFTAKGIHLAESCPEGECTGCRICALMCPAAAITIYKEAAKPKTQEVAAND